MLLATAWLSETSKLILLTSKNFWPCEVALRVAIEAYDIQKCRHHAVYCFDVTKPHDLHFIIVDQKFAYI